MPSSIKALRGGRSHTATGCELETLASTTKRNRSGLRARLSDFNFNIKILEHFENIFGTAPGKGEAGAAVAVVVNDGAAVAKSFFFKSHA
jgi:hypothetical protein